jgi:hypothetical protein
MANPIPDWRTMPTGNAKRNAYYCSREWGLKKEAVHKRSSGICERCAIHKIDNVHHLTYERMYDERLEDLRGLCRGCHEFIHGKSAVDPAELTRIWNLIEPMVDELICLRIRENERRLIGNGTFRSVDRDVQSKMDEFRNEAIEREKTAELKRQVMQVTSHEEARKILAELKSKPRQTT